ncbi:MAG: DUF2461 domain-containing protein [Alphaproteobacteria bacterium]|nr:DUF2461 domain-containing protein [Alphaproteobacteria bacterium]MCW5739858.1 DUF2461 domain-containing protein [Alphaproteobacteria bacterium]
MSAGKNKVEEAFAGFPRDAQVFLGALRDNNTREWFTASRARYETAIKAPGEAFVAALGPLLTARLGAPLTGKIFRVHRDVRFSRDKSPYNAHLHVAFLAGTAGGSGFYMGLEPERLVLGAGVFELSGAALDSLRRAIAAASGARLEAILERLAAAGLRLEGAALKRVPAPYEASHKRAGLLRRKGLTMWRDITEPRLICSPAIVAECLATFESLVPLHRWLQAALGLGRSAR